MNLGDKVEPPWERHLKQRVSRNASPLFMLFHHCLTGKQNSKNIIKQNLVSLLDKKAPD